ncbi:DNA repair and recombination protein RadB [Candidatus Haloredivivus sp. G17]|nr:DNA repair and recombination protein RadB [Candidatus Haloredivivus sp. G17]
MEIERVDTGSDLIDDFLQGGIEKGIITNVYGESGTGKTAFCIQVAAEVAQNGGKVAYIDTEGGFSPERMKQMADEDALENLVIKNPVDFKGQEETIDELEALVEKEGIDLVIVDSAVSLYRLKVNGDNASEINQRLSQQLSELSKIARTQNIPVMITNQVYTSFDEEDLELVGRDVPKYWSKCLIKLSENSSRKMEISKHRSIPRGRSRKFSIANEGIVEEKEGGLF